ncbi:tail protein [Arthrobacter phage Xenomorph]|uniref:Uncharacterized protein n=1 Tax=Arthrobacter phage Xenomorph TaxID=2591069 RepID=A0A514A3S4_9CAUD|nr:tail protein [Arthrobacter phage Xenomorph]QDH47930.1 hypothetical protein SEA_XENOMORPH_17 [Arthrobacter phage Xenomorph]
MSPVYETYPAVDENNNFPPEIKEALFNSIEFKQAKFPQLNVKSFGGALGGGVNNDTAAFQKIADLGAIAYVPKDTYVVDSVSITKDFQMVCEPGTVLLKKANSNVSQRSWWTKGTAMFEIDAPGLTVTMHNFTYDGNNANQPSIEPTGHFIKTYPTSSISTNPTTLYLDRCRFLNGTSGYLNLRGDDIQKRYETWVYLNDCFFADTIYGKGKGDPSTPTALGYSPTYVMLMDHVFLVARNFRAVWNKATATGQYAACAINGTFFGSTYANSGESSVFLHGTTYTRGLGRSGKKYNDDNEYLSNNGIGVIDMYGNGDTLFVENFVGKDNRNVSIRAKGSLKNYTVLQANLTNCHRGLQVSPSSTGACETVAKVGQVNSYGGAIPQVEFVGSLATDRLREVSIEAGYMLGPFTNPENLVNQGVIHTRNTLNLSVKNFNVISAPTLGTSMDDVKNSLWSNINIDGAFGGVGMRLNGGDSHIVENFNINNCSASGVNIITNPKKMVVKHGRITNTVDYGVYSNTTTTELLVDSVEVDGITGVSRGFYAGGGNCAFTRNKASNVTTPVVVATGTRKREENNSWNPAISYGSAAPTAGTYVVGDRVFNTAPAASGTIGWVCVTAGTPGTWKTFGSISA